MKTKKLIICKSMLGILLGIIMLFQNVIPCGNLFAEAAVSSTYDGMLSAIQNHIKTNGYYAIYDYEYAIRLKSNDCEYQVSVPYDKDGLRLKMVYDDYEVEMHICCQWPTLDITIAGQIVSSVHDPGIFFSPTSIDWDEKTDSGMSISAFTSTLLFNQMTTGTNTLLLETTGYSLGQLMSEYGYIFISNDEFETLSTPFTIDYEGDAWLNPTHIYLNAGKSQTLKFENTTQAVEKWGSDNTSIATIDQNGKITGVKAGDTKIYAILNGVKYTSGVHVKGSTSNSSSANKPSNSSQKEKLALSKLSINMTVGKSYRLYTTISADGKEKFKWSSSNPSVATVSSYGTITAKALGTTTITCKLGNQTAKCVVDVNKNTIEVVKGKSVNVTNKIKNIKNYKTAKWASSKTKVATVSNYKIKGLAHGKSSVTIKSSGKTYTITTYVYDPQRLKKEGMAKLKKILKNPSSLIVNSTTLDGNFFYVDYNAMNSFGGYPRGDFLAWYENGTLKYSVNEK